ncbi:unnamed protein product [Urochloa decumbens]|uniref:Protein kinase domain-containing protein n=1 Tax=Urochloa decumbens TaxID=240449 RepID=A0ABC9AUQ9_9POAL
MEEVSIHSQMSHKNVVKLIGYCIGESTLTLVTEYISKGSLDDILHHSSICIPLDIRLGIAIGCAEALNYMHSMHLWSENLVCHGHIKPANILLDGNFTAKVSDFGLSRLLSAGITRYSMSVTGSIDYMDPVYFHEGRLTPKSDVYSFGIVLLELIARKRVRQGDINLIANFSEAFASGNGLRELLDVEIANESSMKILKEVVKLAIECLTLDRHKRPQMNNVAKHLGMLKIALKGRHGNTHDMVHSFSFFRRSARYPRILSEMSSNVRIFTKDEVNEVTDNFRNLIGGGTSAKFYKGTLEDNTVVVVSRFLDDDSKEAFTNGGIILSQIVHKNIIKLLGYCLEDESLFLVYEYTIKGSLLDILSSQEDLPLDLRMKIAIKTAEALEYLHSSATGIIGHGGVAASSILLDDNFMPKLTDFSRACKLIKKSEITVCSSVIISTFLLEKALNNDPSHYGSVLMNLESDVYKFGGILFALISREKNIDHTDLIVKFTRVYEADNTGRAMFDKDITAEEDITVLEEIGKLALRCTILKVDDMPNRPTMKEVVEQLRMLRRSWKEHVADSAPQETEIEAAAAEPRLPNVMRHLFGYRQITTGDPVYI